MHWEYMQAAFFYDAGRPLSVQMLIVDLVVLQSDFEISESVHK